MTRQITYKDWIFEVDFDRTKEVYGEIKTGSLENCECSGCKNLLENRKSVYPKEFKEIMNELGIDYYKESEACHYCKLENGKHLYGAWFHFKGKIIKGKDCKINLPQGGNTFESFPINENFWIAFMKDSTLSFFNQEENNDLIQVEISIHSDWVIDKGLEYD